VSSSRARLAQLGLLAAVLAASGCTSWSRVPDSRPVPRRGTIQVWSEGKPVLVREPRTVGDSLVGREAQPDTTRRSFALAAIDSVRVQDLDMGKALIVGTGVAIAALLIWAQGLNGD
jgi:hypothetical protein